MNLLPNFVRSWLGKAVGRIQALDGGLPPELKFPVFIAGDGGTGRSTALAEISRRAAADHRAVVSFDMRTHLDADGKIKSDAGGNSIVECVNAAVRQASHRIVVVFDFVDGLDHEQMTQLLALSDNADIAVSSSSHCLAYLDPFWHRRKGSIVALRTSPPALSDRLEAEGMPLGREALAQLALGESYQVDMETGRISLLAWPWVRPS